jgi:hypothetical protein
MKEQRSGPRFRFDHVRSARMMGIDGTWQRECTVKDVSDGGAKLTVGDSIEGLAAQGVLPGAVVDRTGVSALQAGLGERRPDRRDVCATEAGEAAVRACGSPRPSQEVQDAYGRRPRAVSCLMAIQLPKQPSDRLNVPEPVFPDNCPTAVRVMPFPAPTECNVPSGST